MRARVATPWIAAAVGVGALICAGSCRAPTEITVVLYTDTPCEKVMGSTVRVGALAGIDGTAPKGSSSACDRGALGSLVVVPSGATDDEVALEVTLGVGRDPGGCDGAGFGPGCIVARRAIRFLPHTPLRIAVPLRQACNGVRCLPTETCVNGKCASATIGDPSACEGQGCDEGALGPSPGSDAGPGDAGAAGDAPDTGDVASSDTIGPPGPAIVSQTSVVSPSAGFSMVDLDVDWSRKLAYAATRESGRCFYVIDFQDELAPKLISSIGSATSPATLGDTCLGTVLNAAGNHLLVGNQGANQIELWDLGPNPRAAAFTRLSNTSSLGGPPRRILWQEDGGTSWVFAGTGANGVQAHLLDEASHAFTTSFTYTFPGATSGEDVNELALVLGTSTSILAASDADGDPALELSTPNLTPGTSFPMTDGATTYWFWTAASSGDRKKAFVGGTAGAFFDVTSGMPAVALRIVPEASYFRAATFAQIDGKDLFYVVRSDGWVDVFDVTNASTPNLVVHHLLASKNGELYGIRVDPVSRRAVVVTNRGDFFVLNVGSLTPATTQYLTY
jgi:hypothetical protein